MVLIAQTMKHPQQTQPHTRLHADNENEVFSFVTLAAATANVVRYLQKDRDQAPDSEANKNPENEADAQRERDRFLETRLREIDRFERRYISGQDRTRR